MVQNRKKILLDKNKSQNAVLFCIYLIIKSSNIERSVWWPSCINPTLLSLLADRRIQLSQWTFRQCHCRNVYGHQPPSPPPFFYFYLFDSLFCSNVLQKIYVHDVKTCKNRTVCVQYLNITRECDRDYECVPSVWRPRRNSLAHRTGMCRSTISSDTKQ